MGPGARTGKIDDLMHQIEQMDLLRRARGSPQVESTLISLRQELLRLLDKRSLHIRDHFLRLTYEYSNKCSSSLARLIHPKPRSNSILAMRSLTRGMIHRNADSAATFRAYYEELYDLRRAYRDPSSAPKVANISPYLTNTLSRPLTPLRLNT